MNSYGPDNPPRDDAGEGEEQPSSTENAIDGQYERPKLRRQDEEHEGDFWCD